MDKEKDISREKKATKSSSKRTVKNSKPKKEVKTPTRKKTEKPSSKTETVKIEKEKIMDEEKTVNIASEEKEVIKNAAPVLLAQEPEVDKQAEFKVQQQTENKDDTFSLIEVIGLLIASIIISLAIGVVLGNGYVDKGSLTSTSTTDEILKNYHYIKEEYPDISEDDLLKGAIEGMLKEVNDPYAAFIDQDSSFDIEIKGTYTGLGLQVTTLQAGELIVSKVFEGSSADSAGIKVNDKLIKIDDLVLSDKTGSDFATYVKNKNKGSFKITLMRDDQELTFTVEKKKINIVSVHEDTFGQDNKKIGYLKIDVFSGTTYNQFKDKLSKLEKGNIDSLIIDLRGNSGGLLTSVTDMLSLMLDSSKVMYKTDDKGNIETFYSKGKKSKDYDIVVLIDSESASASEIMAAALRDNLGAKLVGTKSYGKGTVQQVKTLSNGDEYKVTTKKWLTPKGECVERKGLEPDYHVLLDEDYQNNPSHETDKQLKKAIELLK